MNFIKNFFNDESKIIGLCGFKTIRTKYSKKTIEPDFFFNPFENNKAFETNFKKNVLLKI